MANNDGKNTGKLIKIDPNKIKIIQASGPTFTIPQFVDIMNRQAFNVSNTITTSGSTFTVPQFVDVVNRQDFNVSNTIATTSRPTFIIVPSSFVHSQPVVDSTDNIERSLVKTKASLSLSADAPKENWTEAEIQLLLERCLSMNSKFENPNSRKTPYWNLIVKDFEEKGYKVIVQDLINKWKNLQVTYNRNASKLKRTGESAITWKYFQQMHEIFAEKKV